MTVPYFPVTSVDHPPMAPPGWAWRLLREVARLESGHTPSRREPSYWEGGDVPWLSLKDIRGLTGRYVFDTEDKPTQAGINNSSARVLPKGTVAFCRTASVGKVVILGRDMATSQDFANWVCGPELLPEYLYEALRASGGQFDKDKQGTTHKTIYMPVLERFRVLMPSLTEQRRIADILDKADAIRRKRKEAIALTEELLRSAFLEMFGDPVTNPKKWPPVPLASLARVVTGNTPSRAVPEYFGNDIEWIKSDNINTPGHYLTRATEGLSATGKEIGRTALSGSTLMTCIAGSPDCIGNVALTDREVAFNQQINAITPYEGVDYRFLYVMLLVGKRLVQAASTNSMKGMVSKGKLEQVQFPAPPSQLQEKFGEIFDRIVRLSRRHELAEDHSKLLFESLFGHAFRGASASPNVIGGADTDVAAR